MGRFIVGKNYIAFTMRGELLKIEPYGIDRLRIRASRNTILSDERWTLLPSAECEYSIENNANSVKLICGILSAEIVQTWNNYQIIFRKNGKKYCVHTATVTVQASLRILRVIATV